MKLRCVLILLLMPLMVWANDEDKKEQEQRWSISVSDFLYKSYVDTSLKYGILHRVKLDTLYQDHGINLNITEELAYHLLREDDVDKIYSDIRQEMGVRKRKKVHITVDGLPLEQYVPSYYASKKDKERMNKPYKGVMNVQNISKPYTIKVGLSQRHIALWNSHGCYYNRELDIWKWQRAPLFTTVEDLYTSSYVLPFLVPMIENAGANVYLPRERDIQTNEVVVDNEDAEFDSYGEVQVCDGGFKNGVTLDSTSINPFCLGTHCVLGADAKITWQANVPQDGRYAVYISYVTVENSSDAAEYEVYHSGCVTRYKVNQQMGGGTWIYLGEFYFTKDSEAKIVLRGNKKGVVTADAVRLGGGMGSVVRGGKTSALPRWEEAARYYLQYAGALDTITFNRHGDSIDYNDDFRCRARWVNYLKGGRNIEPWLSKGAEIEGLHIPIDLSLGLHSDAGHFLSMDTTVGALAIYSTYDVGKNRNFYCFDKKKSRLANRDLADLVQTQVVDDIRALYDRRWKRREIWDKMYSEATFAQCPSMLLEVLAHANALDMRYGLDPQFRFDVSRAIYKAVLRFFSTYYNAPYEVQPLPVSDVAIVKEGKQWKLTWLPVKDVLEPTAMPEEYVVYSRIEGEDWDNGTLVKKTSFEISVTDTLVRSYKVTAVNAGGESFPSTILSCGMKNENRPTVLVVDGFTRVSAPFFMERGDSVGVAPWLDEGVAWNTDIATIGWQYIYNQNDPWRSDDVPGHGGSHNNLAGTVFAGNRFDNALVHVNSIVKAGCNAVSVSLDAVLRGEVDLSQFDVVDLVLGEQRSTTMPLGKVKYAIYSLEMMQCFRGYLNTNNARLLITGAHIADDAFVDTTAQLMSERKRFVNEKLGFSYGGVIKEDYNALFLVGDTLMFRYNTDYNLEQYRVENADVLVPENGATVTFSYLKDEGAVLYYEPSYKVVSSGVPFESVKGAQKRDNLMSVWLDYLLKQ